MAVLDLGKVVPEKGVDYFTQQDINAIEADVVSDIKTNVKVSDLQNDAGYITKEVNNLTNYTLATGTGATIDLSINSSTYVMTLDLKNSAGTTISTDSIDLPLETMVVGATYDSQNKKIVLTLKNGETIDVPVGDLVSGLQTEITSQNKLSSDLVDDTDKTNKFVTATEKTTWSGKYDKPSGGIPSTDMSSAVQTSLGKADTAIQDISGKQDVLVSGTNIKTINSESILGSGDITISGGGKTQVVYIGNNYITNLNTTNAQDIVDAMIANNTDTIYVGQNKSGYRNGDFSMVICDPILSTSTTSYKFYAYRMTPNYTLANTQWARQAYTVTVSWSDSVPTVTAISKDGSLVSEYIHMNGEQQSWTPSTDYSPASKKYVDDTVQITQYSTMPTANANRLGKIVQYIGTTTSSYVNGYFYKCVSDGEATPTYSWEKILVEKDSLINLGYKSVNNLNKSLIQKLIDGMFINGVQEIKFQGTTAYNVMAIYGATLNTELSTNTTSYTLLVLKLQLYETGIVGSEKQSYNVTITWTDGMPVVSNTSKNGSYITHNTYPNGNTDQWTPSTDYSPVHKKYVDDQIVQYSTLPTASLGYVGKIAQYIGATDSTYTNGYFYKCVTDGSTYSWEAINVQAGGGSSGGVIAVSVDDADINFTDATGSAKWEAIYQAHTANPGSVIVMHLDRQCAVYIESWESSGEENLEIWFLDTPSSKGQIANQSDYCMEFTMYKVTMAYNPNNDQYWHRTNDNFYGLNKCKVLTNSMMDIYGNAPDPASIRFVFKLSGLNEYEWGGNYSVGDYVTFENLIYKCNTATTEEDFDPNKWDQKTYLQYLSDQIAV